MQLGAPAAALEPLCLPPASSLSLSLPDIPLEWLFPIQEGILQQAPIACQITKAQSYLQQCGTKCYTRIHRDLAPTQIAVAANPLNLLWVHHSRPSPFSVKGPQPLTVEALSPHVQGDGVPPLPMGLISIPASWSIPLPPLSAGHLESQNG